MVIGATFSLKPGNVRLVSMRLMFSKCTQNTFLMLFRVLNTNKKDSNRECKRQRTSTVVSDRPNGSIKLRL